ncbi:hypothetical protein [uncultured Methylobacterium sp.]|jgi:hypothetical protein|uniref:hypothetical protein n=1 Tax=uncultured Methylobacterium sp. TaxID=157278 RepID=UPI00261AD7D3|nr:hypothetical protein [uncultured Methylobacterium sp.]
MTASPTFREPVAIPADDIAWFRRFRCEAFDGGEGETWALVPDGFTLDEILEAAFEEPDAPAVARAERVTCAFFLYARFAPAEYRTATAPGTGETVDVTPEHLRLLQITHWRAVVVDDKRPYGRSCAFTFDMAKRLGILPVTDPVADDALPPGIEERLLALHRSMPRVMQAFIDHAELAPGTYLLPQDGWHGRIAPRLAPPSPSRVAAYRAAVALPDATPGRAERVRDAEAAFLVAE